MKQQCELNQYIAINDKLKMDIRVFISNRRNGEESKTEERQKVRMRERQSTAGREG